MRVFVVEEYSEGEFECAGENYKSLVVFDLFKLDELSRDKFKNIMLKKREEQNPEAEFVPKNGKSWSFEDIKNEIDVYIEESGKGVRGFERNEYIFDLNNKEEEEKFIELMSSHIKDRNGNTQVDSLYVENELNYFLSEEEIKSADITKEINISVVSTVNVNIKGTEISKSIKERSVNLNDYY
jgi:hypothetical protein